MRTTVDIPDQVFRMAKRVAAERGRTLRDLFTEALIHELSGRGVAAKRVRRPLPEVKVPAHAPILSADPAVLAQAEADADLEKVREIRP